MEKQTPAESKLPETFGLFIPNLLKRLRLVHYFLNLGCGDRQIYGRPLTSYLRNLSLLYH